MLSLSGQACLQRLWPVSTSGTSSGAGGPAPATTAAPAEEKKVEAKTVESEESDDDVGSGLFSLSLFSNTFKKKLSSKKRKKKFLQRNTSITPDLMQWFVYTWKVCN